MTRRTVVGSLLVVSLLVAGLAAPNLLSHESTGVYRPDVHWSAPYHDHLFSVEDAEAAGYVPAEPECVPGMGYHYIHPEEAQAWFSGQQGGLQVLLYGDTGFLVGVEYLITAPDLDAPSIVGMTGPMEGHIEGMPVHYEQHIYFNKPRCPNE